MKTPQQKYEEHLNRIKKVLALEKPDRTPILMCSDLFSLKYGDPTAKASDMVTRPEWAHEKIREGTLKLGDIDMATMLGHYPPTAGLVYFSETKVPGRDLPEDSVWQIHEVGKMTVEDYDVLMEKGYPAFMMDMAFNRLGYTMEEFTTGMKIMNDSAQGFKDVGIVSSGGVTAAAHFEMLTAARGMKNMMLDLYRMPDKLDTVLNLCADQMEAFLRGQIRMKKPMFVFVPGTRSGDGVISKPNFERFVWKHLRKFIDIIIEEGSNVLFHIDSKWDSRLPYFAELPPKRCILCLDSLTDIFLAKKIVGDVMCIEGDVPPAMFTIGTPDDVYNYCIKLIKEIGPGFMLGAGCSVPYNAKPENVEAMVAAATGK